MERREVIAKEPDGSEWVAFCGRFKDGGGFPSTRINRRHRYGGGSFHPADIYIGKRVDGEMRPVLFFRDVGSHDTSPHDFAIDGDGRFHLAVADVDIGQNNRLEVYWLVGDPKSRRWKAAWLVDHRRTFTYAASPRLTSWDHHMQLVWFVERPRAESREEGTDAPRAAGAREAREEPSCTSIYHVAWKPAGFGPKVRVIAFPGAITGFDVAQDPRTGTLLIAFSTGRGISLIARSRDGRWSRVEALDPSVPCGRPVSVAALGDGRFVIRAGPGWMDPGMVAAAEWLLIPGPAQE